MQTTCFQSSLCYMYYMTLYFMHLTVPLHVTCSTNKVIDLIQAGETWWKSDTLTHIAAVQMRIRFLH